jgi:hypothetical protein
MRSLRRFFHRLVSWTTAQRDEERLQAEIEEHLALQTAENLRAGLSPADARREAAWKFGGVEAMEESYREQRGLPLAETLIRDSRLALRRLRMAPVFTLATTLTLALGIGATTSIFTLAHAVLLKALPVARPDELYRVGRKAHCCYLAGYSQDKEFSLVNTSKGEVEHHGGEGQRGQRTRTPALCSVRKLPIGRYRCDAIQEHTGRSRRPVVLPGGLVERVGDEEPEFVVQRLGTPGDNDHPVNTVPNGSSG